MTDCPNAEMRDRLADLLHERLDASARAVVVAHVERCAECRSELALLREARLALTSGVQSLDVEAVARVIVERTRTPVVRPVPLQAAAGQRWMDWRIAASVALLLLGGGSFVALRSVRVQPQPSAPTVAATAPVVVPTPNVDTPGAVASAPRRHAPPATSLPAPATELSAAGGIGDLSESDLRALLDDLGRMDAVTPSDPEPVTVRVAVPGERGS